MDEILNYSASPEDDYYAIIGCGTSATIQQINTEFKIKAKDLHPDKNLDSSIHDEKFARLQRAREVLTDETLRAEYDRWRRSEIAIPFESWKSMRKGTHAGMHWASPQTKPMLEDGKPSALPSEVSHTGQSDSVRIVSDDDDFVWQRAEPSESLRRFREHQF